MSVPSNIKIQKTGAEEVGNAQVRSTASDLERSKDVSSLKGASKAALRCRSQAATVGVCLKSARQSGSSNGLRVCVI
jgi:hypothetical protein